MSRKETESEKEVAAKWKKVSNVKAAYDGDLLPTGAPSSDPEAEVAGTDSLPPRPAAEPRRDKK
jgi:hypothetical protein